MRPGLYACLMYVLMAKHRWGSRYSTLSFESNPKELFTFASHVKNCILTTDHAPASSSSPKGATAGCVAKDLSAVTLTTMRADAGLLTLLGLHLNR